MTVARAASLFGVSKEAIFYKIYTQKKFRSVFRVGSQGDTLRPVVLLNADEVRQVLEQERADAEAVAGPDSFATLLNAWNRRVKEWGVQQQWADQQIHVKGRPPEALVDAYLAAHPDDLRPQAED